MAENDRKPALISELAAARLRLTANLHALRDDLDFSAKAKRTFARQPAAWVGGAAMLGLLIARIPSRTKKVVMSRRGEKAAANVGKAGLLLGALKIGLDFARPALTKWATQRFTDYVSTPRSTRR